MDDEWLAQFNAEKDMLRSNPQGYVDMKTMQISREPGESGGYFSRHQGWLSLGLMDKALADLDMCLQLSPHYMDYYSRGNLLSDLGRHQEALDDYNRAEELAGSKWVSMWGPLFQADCHSRLGHATEALAACARLKEDHWTPGLNGAPAGSKAEVITEVRRRLAATKKVRRINLSDGK